jgi:succinylglutamate desuccinylase
MEGLSPKERADQINSWIYYIKDELQQEKMSKTSICVWLDEIELEAKVLARQAEKNIKEATKGNE